MTARDGVRVVKPSGTVLLSSAMSAPVDRDIQRLNDDYCAAYNAGDLEKVMAFFAEDAITLSPDQVPVRGREAHRKYMAAGFARESKRKLTLTSIRSQRVGDLCCDAGEWTQTFGALGAKGYYLTVYRREQGGWKVVTTTFNVRQQA